MVGSSLHEQLRQLPSVDKLVSKYHGQADLPRPVLVDLARGVLQVAREAAMSGTQYVPDIEACLDSLHQAVVRYKRQQFTRTINATGVILHTNLGRAPLATEAAEHVAAFAQGYTNLEFDIEHGTRGSRYVHCEDLLCRLTGAEAALVVNNNAAAMLLVLSAVASGGEVIVSRGELIEIGGGFRIPELLEQSGCTLREVGTTNRTRLSDYEAAIGPDVRALLKVHTSNYRIVGFSEAVDGEKLADLGRRHSIPVIEDLGSGVLLDTRRFGLSHEPSVADAVQSGVDVVAFSGDKLLGGPQAGILVGREDLIERCARHPLTRALRVDKMTLAALHATLHIYLRGDAERKIPIWQMIAAPVSQIEERARKMQAHLATQAPALKTTLEPGRSAIGGGALPTETIPTALLAVRSKQFGAEALARRLRHGTPAVVARVENNTLLIDLRTVAEVDDDSLIASLVDAVHT